MTKSAGRPEAGLPRDTPFADLHAERAALPDVAIVAVGGLAIVRRGDAYTLCGEVMDTAVLRQRLLEGLGLGAVLTHMNPNQKSLLELGEMCRAQNHLWTAHVLTLTVAVASAPLAVRNAFAFDRRFHLSWVAKEVSTPRCTFTATGSLREWHRLQGYADDDAFADDVRAWFLKIRLLLAPLFD
jgi:hypothetical protein